MWYAGLFLVLIGFVMSFKPAFIWTLLESWKSQDATGPSDLYILSTRIGGVIAMVVGLTGIVLYWTL